MTQKTNAHGSITRRQFVRKAGVGAVAAGAAAVGLGGKARAAPAESWIPDTTIVGTDNPAVDVPAVQGAVNDFSRILLKGTFNFGDGTNYPRQTVVISRGVEIRGEVLKDQSGKIVGWQTVISGGGAIMPYTYQGVTFDGPGGAFRLESSDNVPIVFYGIQFRKWSAVGLFAFGCNGLDVRGCKFNEADSGLMFGGSPDPSLSDLIIITPVFAVGPGTQGAFVAEDNVSVIEDSLFTDDDQFVALEFTSFSQVRCARNDIYSHDETISVFCNGLYAGPSFSSTISITDNKMKVRCRPMRFAGGSVGTMVMANVNSTAEIRGNDIDLAGYDHAIALSGENITVRNNRIILGPNGPYPAVAAFMIGANTLNPLGIPFLGGLNNSVISNNIISGSAIFALYTWNVNDPFLNPYPPSPPQPPNDSHGNVFMGNNTDNLVPIVSTLWLSYGSHDNVFKGGFGSVYDLGMNNLITGYTPMAGSGAGPQISDSMRHFGPKALGHIWLAR